VCVWEKRWNFLAISNVVRRNKISKNIHQLRRINSEHLIHSFLYKKTIIKIHPRPTQIKDAI